MFFAVFPVYTLLVKFRCNLPGFLHYIHKVFQYKVPNQHHIERSHKESNRRSTGLQKADRL